jgi:predicted DNA-binding protein
VKYIKNKNIQITFTIKEELYFRFKTLCNGEKKNPATVLKEFVKKYVDERGHENDE